MSGKLEILWAPIRDRFITWGSEISLYEIQPTIESELNSNLQSIKVSDTASAHLLTTNPNYHYVKSIDIYPKSYPDLLLAIGLSNGRVVLTHLGPFNYDSNAQGAKELISVQRHGRQCNVVSFNPIESHLLAGGLDKFRSDNSVLIWDISRCISGSNHLARSLYSNSSGSNNINNNNNNLGSETLRPVSEFGTSEMTNSLAWFNNRLLACGMNLKAIKLYDIRDSDKMVNSTLTKAVFGLCVDPHEEKRLASFVENQVSIWDLRNFDKPVVVLPNNRPIFKIEWCPTKYNLLGVLQRDNNVIHLHDIEQTGSNSSSEEMEPVVLERIITPGLQQTITSFSWHNSDENRFLAINTAGSIVDYTVFDRITLNWSPAASLAWTYGRKTMKYVSDSRIDDISNKMKERAKKGYGLENELYKNAKMVENNEVLANVWNWIHLSGKLVESGIISDSPTKHPGISSVLRIDPDMNKSEMVTTNWADLGYPNCQGSAKYYKHEDRDKALSLCSWPTDRDPDSLNRYIEQLEKEQAYTRAAAIAVFNLKLKNAIEILSRTPITSEFGSTLNVVAMALSGFSDDKNSVWRQFCSSSKTKLTDPYLKCMFAFLTTDNHNYEPVLNEPGITVDDRVAFACKFLTDNKLLEYLKKLDHKLTEEGNLDGLLLTGNCPEGQKLLQKYLDVTGDIQSTALIAVRAFSDDLHLQNVKDWIEGYRNLLDTWKLWYNRADFDIMLASYRLNEKPPQQVYVSCNFCGKSISAYMHGFNRTRGAYTRLTAGTTNKVKLTSCPSCRKPLPRCSICLMYMGTSMGEDESGTDFDNWFTWCQTCRHGGHAGHVIEWFDLHQECPVTGCSCKCLAIDFHSGSSM